MEPKIPVEYQKLGPSGLKVSRISFGNMNFDDEKKEDDYQAIIKQCFDVGINYIDTSESYGANKSEQILGRILQKLKKNRDKQVISTKLFYGSRGFMNPHPVNTDGLSRKHIYEGAMNSLKRLQLDYADVIFCHRPDPEVPMQEICRGYNWLIDHGKCFYWGTSEWSAYEIMESYATCDRLNLVRPIVEQPQYNMLTRDRFEVEYAPLFEKYKMGSTIWSPLAGGYLTGKQQNEIPKGIRMENPIFKSFFYDPQMADPVTKEKNLAKMKQLMEVANALKCTMAQLAIAWTLKNKDVSTALIGPSSVKQLNENLVAFNIVKLLTPSVEEQLEKILDNKPKMGLDWKKMIPLPSRR